MNEQVTNEFALAASMCKPTSLMCPEKCPFYGEDECPVDPGDRDQFKALGAAVFEARTQRDTAWKELREIRAAIKADENESTADEVKSLLAKYLTAKRTLEDHGPEGHSVTNQQYVDLEKEYNDALRVWETTMMESVGEDGPGSVVEAINKIKTQREELLAALKGLRACINETRGMNAYDALVSADTVIAKFKEAPHVG